MFFVPIVGVQLFEGILRYLLDPDEKEKQREVVSTSFYFLAVNLLFLNIFFAAINQFVVIPHSSWVILYFNFYFINFYLQRIARGLQFQKAFAISGIINTVVLAFVSLLLLIFYEFKTEGLLIAYFSGSLVSSVYLIFATKIRNNIKLSSFSRVLLKQLLVYSIPLLFDAVLWWTMNLSDRLVLGYFNGTGDVGIYSVANKFAALLTFINHIFYLVWQEYAIIQSKEKGKEEEFKKIFLQYLRVQFTGVLLLMPLSKLAIELFIDDKFISSYVYVPPLLLGAMFSAFAAFYGLFYQIEKNTKGALYTSMVAGVLNLSANIILIPIYGIWAAAGSTAVAFFVLWIVRIFLLQKHINIKNIFSIPHAFSIILLAVSIFLFYSEGMIYQVVNLVGASILFLYLNWQLILNLMAKKKVIE